MFCDVLINLISQTITDTSDDYGNPVIETINKTVYAVKKAVKRNEFYQAQAVGLVPQIVFECFEFDYNGEKIVEHDGKRYNVIRSYPLSGEKIEIICNDLAEVG